jgi:hypothetical protein
VGSEFLNTMWVPDTFFVNEKTSYFHTATTSNEFLRIQDNGDILRSIRLTVTASCPMDLRHFPMDSQLCNIEIESCKDFLFLLFGAGFSLSRFLCFYFKTGFSLSFKFMPSFSLTITINNSSRLHNVRHPLQMGQGCRVSGGL